jgi:predicted nuclease of predicted toxin-antitoxin system
LSSHAVLRLILDQGVPRDAARLLRELGYDCRHVGELQMSRATDAEILAWAREQGATVVTLDADFHAMLAVSGASSPSVVRIRLEGLDARAMVELLSSVLVTYSSDLRQGAFVTVKSHKVTHHRLPIGRSE